jgi:hypothetical protein
LRGGTVVDEGAGARAGENEAERTRFDCPECPEYFEQPEQLGAHLERHRAAEASDTSGIPCPRSCGRVFKFHERRELKDHSKNCDGSPPLPVAPFERRPPALPPDLPNEDETIVQQELDRKRQAEGIGRPEPETGDVPKETRVAGKLIYRKGCGKGFNREAWREKHEDLCKGASAKKTAGEGAAARFAAIREKRKQVDREDRVIDAGASAIVEALKGLYAKRQAILDGLPELQDINKAIAALEAIAGPPPAAEREAS